MTSPIIIKQNFLSPLQCEGILNDFKTNLVNLDSNKNPIATERKITSWEADIAIEFSELIVQIEQNYGCAYKGLHEPVLQMFPENPSKPAKNIGCENSEFFRKKWVMKKDVDLVGYIWLKTYNDNIQNGKFDINEEIYGGCLEFPQFNFHIKPEAGTLVILPAGPHFLTAISPVMVGDLYQIKLNISVKNSEGKQWFYDPSKFPKSYQEWFFNNNQ